MKHLILKVSPSGNIDCEDFDRGLLELRNTPNFTGRSPAQVLYGHHLRSCVPAHPKSFSQEWQAKTEECDRRAAERAADVAARYDCHARPLPRLSIGQQIRIQDPVSHRWDKVGVVMGIGRSRDYQVRLPSGRVWWRNRRFLRPVELPSVDPSPVESPNVDVSKVNPSPPCVSAPVLCRSERLRNKRSAQDETMSV